MQTSEPLKAHPFELAGMGTGPFRFVGLVSIPSASLAEQNPFAYQNALAMLPRDIIGGCGTCYNCGMAIMNVCIIENSTGQRYGVGTDCVQHTGDKYLGDKVKVAVARLQREQRRRREDIKREAKRQEWLASVCNERGETNAQRLDRENKEREDAKKTREQATLNKFGFLLPILSAASRTDGDFCYNMAARIRNGNEITGRALEIVGEIYAKQFGRRGSKGYDAALAEFDKRLEA